MTTENWKRNKVLLTQVSQKCGRSRLWVNCVAWEYVSSGLCKSFGAALEYMLEIS